MQLERPRRFIATSQAAQAFQKKRARLAKLRDPNRPRVGKPKLEPRKPATSSDIVHVTEFSGQNVAKAPLGRRVAGRGATDNQIEPAA